MAKAFSDKEKQQLITALKKEAEQCIIRYGIRKTSIDELVQRVGISKGSFYTFFPSKEMLFFEVITDYHNPSTSVDSRASQAAWESTYEWSNCRNII